MARKEPVEQRGARAADVQIAGRRGSEARHHGGAGRLDGRSCQIGWGFGCHYGLFHSVCRPGKAPGTEVGAAPSMATRRLQTPIGLRIANALRRGCEAVETRLEAERERVGLWLPVALGAGIAAWFALPAKAYWAGLLWLVGGGVLLGLSIGWNRRAGRMLAIGCGAAALGILLIWARALSVAAPILAQPVSTAFPATVETAEPLPAKGETRLILRPVARPRSAAAGSRNGAWFRRSGDRAGRPHRAARTVDAAAVGEPSGKLRLRTARLVRPYRRGRYGAGRCERTRRIAGRAGSRFARG
jgi:hypothetical protein